MQSTVLASAPPGPKPTKSGKRPSSNKPFDPAGKGKDLRNNDNSNDDAVNSNINDDNENKSVMSNDPMSPSSLTAQNNNNNSNHISNSNSIIDITVKQDMEFRKKWVKSNAATSVSQIFEHAMLHQVQCQTVNTSVIKKSAKTTISRVFDNALRSYLPKEGKLLSNEGRTSKAATFCTSIFQAAISGAISYHGRVLSNDGRVSKAATSFCTSVFQAAISAALSHYHTHASKIQTIYRGAVVRKNYMNSSTTSLITKFQSFLNQDVGIGLYHSKLYAITLVKGCNLITIEELKDVYTRGLLENHSSVFNLNERDYEMLKIYFDVHLK